MWKPGETLFGLVAVLLACLRTGQYFGGYSNLTPAALVHAIDKLLRVGRLNPHSSSARQYKLLTRAGVIRLENDTKPGGAWKVPTLIDTPDNRAAIRTAVGVRACARRHFKVPADGRRSVSARAQRIEDVSNAPDEPSGLLSVWLTPTL